MLVPNYAFCLPVFIAHFRLRLADLVYCSPREITVQE